MTGRLQVARQLSIESSGSLPIPQPLNAAGVCQVWLDENGKAFAQGYAVTGTHYLAFAGLCVFAFGESDENVVAVAEPGVTTELIEDLFWRSALPLVLQMQGYGALHASAILTPSGVVGFCAQAGTGKSTLAYGLSLRGFPIWTDDALVFDAVEEPVVAAALPFKVRMRPDPADYYQARQFGKQNDSYWQREYQRAPREVAAVRAIVVLKRSDDENSAVSVNQIKGGQALAELLEHAYAFSLGKVEQRRSMTEQYLGLAEQVPVFALQFPSGLQQLTEILELLDIFLSSESSLK